MSAVNSNSDVLRKEPLQQPQRLSRKYILFPLQYPTCWDYYKRAENAFWTTSELDLTGDRADWLVLPAPVRGFLSTVLAFFTSSDMIVVNNLQEDIDFLRIEIPEIRTFYAFQSAVEAIHTETYCRLIETYVQDPDESERLQRPRHDALGPSQAAVGAVVHEQSFAELCGKARWPLPSSRACCSPEALPASSGSRRSTRERWSA